MELWDLMELYITLDTKEEKDQLIEEELTKQQSWLNYLCSTRKQANN